MYKLIENSTNEQNYFNNTSDDLILECSRGLRIPRDPKNPLGIKIPEDININHIIYDQIKKNERVQDSNSSGIPLYMPLYNPTIEDMVDKEKTPSNRGVIIIDYSI